jgi:putative phosphoribosyl transferase
VDLVKASSPATGSETAVEIRIDSASLQGTLSLPKDAKAVVIFAHGSGSSRFSPRNTYVASVLQGAGLGTLLFDLLTSTEDRVYDNRFDIDLLAARLAGATDWLLRRPETRAMRVGYFGASTGAAAALQASVGRPEVRAVVSRGGRPDLAWDYLGRVEAPTLLLVGGDDPEVIRLNEEARARLSSEKKLVIIPGATHLFEEPGTLEEVARQAKEWFVRFLK